MDATTIAISHPLARGASARPADVWEFTEGLIGLPNHRRFALIPLEDAPPFRLLASLEDPAFGLVVVEPTALIPDYELALSARDLSPLVERDPRRLLVLVPVVLPGPNGALSLNLKGPLVLSPAERRGVQRVSTDERHPVRWTPASGPGLAPCSS